MRENSENREFPIAKLHGQLLLPVLAVRLLPMKFFPQKKRPRFFTGAVFCFEEGQRRCRKNSERRREHSSERIPAVIRGDGPTESRSMAKRFIREPRQPAAGSAAP